MDQPPRQTLSYLRTLFTERGIRPKNKLGQNFLIDLNLLELIVREAELVAKSKNLTLAEWELREWQAGQITPIPVTH